MDDRSRRLAAVMFTDMVGYSKLMNKNESLALSLLHEHRKIVRGLLASFHGREVDTTGDGFVIEFSSTLDAVNCAIEMQRSFDGRNKNNTGENKIHIRIGIHVSDVIRSNADSKGGIYGDGVNVAARLQPLAPAGGICISGAVFEQVDGKINFPIRPLGTPKLKGIDNPIRIYSVELGPGTAQSRIRKPQRLLRPAIVVCLAVLVGVLFNMWIGTKPSSEDYLRVAVMPFETSGLSTDEDYLSDGLAGGIISELSQRGIHVLAKTSVVELKKSMKTPTQIGTELNLDRLVTGRLQKRDGAFYVSVSLVDTHTQEVIWSQDFKEPSNDTFEIQSTVASSLDNHLRPRTLASIPDSFHASPAINNEAYLAFLKGQFFLGQRTHKGLLNAVSEFEKAIQKDPKYAAAYGALATSMDLMSWYGILDPLEATTKNVNYANQALALDPHSVDGLLALAEEKVYVEYDFKQGESFFQRAIQANPRNPTVHQWYAEYLAYRGRIKESYAEAGLAKEIDPLNLAVNTAVGTMHFFGNDIEGAKAIYRDVLNLDPNFMQGHYWLGRSLLVSKDFRNAIEELNKAAQLSPEEPMVIAMQTYAYAVAGQTKEANAIYSSLKERAKVRYMSPFLFALIEAGLGHEKQSLDFLRRSVVEHGSQTVSMLVDPAFNSLRGLKEFRDISGKIFSD